MIFDPLKKWKPVVVESPFKGTEEYTEEAHRAYLEKCLLDCIKRGETPYASHKQLTDCLVDSDPEQRAIGISAGISMAIFIVRHGGKPAFYVDLGWSGGMTQARDYYDSLGIGYELRRIYQGGP